MILARLPLFSILFLIYDSFTLTSQHLTLRDGNFFTGGIVFPSELLINGRVGDSCQLPGGQSGKCAPHCQSFNRDLYRYGPIIYTCSSGIYFSQKLYCCPQEEISTVPSTEKPETYSSTSTYEVATTEIPQNTLRDKNKNGKISTTVEPISIQSQGGIKTSTPNSDDESITLVDSSNSKLACGVFNSSEQASSQWPWIVSLGRRVSNKYNQQTIEWTCLGTLITSYYIVTTANCLQKAPNVVALGEGMIGRMKYRNKPSYKIVLIKETVTHQKYKVSSTPHLYKNIGLIRISEEILPGTNILPICFPFLAGVLDIIPFAKFKAQSLGFYPKDKNGKKGIKFVTEEYSILKNDDCSKVINARSSPRMPTGLHAENMCGYTKCKAPPCPAPGSPLVIFDKASESHVIIGINAGDPNCTEYRRKLIIFTRINAFSTFVRTNVNELPSPPECLF